MVRKEQTLMDFPVPSTTGYEHKLLATIIQDNSLATEIMSIVKREMFSNEHTQKIWDVFVDMYYKREKIDLLTIFPKVDNKYFIDNILTTEVEYSFTGTMQLALSFLDTYIKRKAYFSAVDILQKINAGETSDSIREQFDRFSTKVTEGLGDKIADDAESIANEIADDIEKGNRTRVSTHIRTLDYYTYGGFGGGNLVILAARPSVGKTTIAMQIAQAASADLNRTLVFSLEMTKQELVQRLIQSTGLISQYQFCTNTIDWENYEKAISQVINGDLLINDEAYNINEIRQKIVIACQTQKIKMVMIDYLQLIKGANPRLSKADQVGEITSILKQTAKQCNIPILVLAQLNRASASENRSPQLYDLRDSGSIEQDADIVIMLERPRNELGNIADNKIDMWIRKNRQGRCNFDSPISLKGNEYYTNFVEE